MMEKYQKFYHTDEDKDAAEESDDDDDDATDTESDHEETPWSLIIEQAKARHRE